MPGKQRVLWLVVVLVCAVGCTPARNGGKPGRPPPRPTAPGAGPATVAASCQVATPAGWQHAMTGGRLATPDGASLAPIAVSADGTTVFAQHSVAKGPLPADRTAGTIVRVDVATGSRTVVYTMRDPVNDQQAGASFDGRWLVFGIQHSLTTYHDWSIHAWDSATGRTVDLARSPRDAAGKPLTGPIVYPLAAGGRAIWTQRGPAGGSQIHLYDLARGVDTVAHQGHAGSPVIFDGLLIWPEAPDAGKGRPRLRAMRLSDGVKVDPPGPLADLHELESIDARGSTFAWVEGHYRRVRAWRSGWPAPRTLFESPRESADRVTASGDLVAWTVAGAGPRGPGVFVADLRTGGCVAATARFGAAIGGDDAIVVSAPAEQQKSSNGRFDSYLLRPSTLPPLPAAGSATVSPSG